MSLLPLIAALFAVPQFLPQLGRLRRTGDTAGVSCAWAALTSVNNGAWTAYFALSRLWTALAPSISATLLAGTLAVWLARQGELSRRAALSITGWAALLAAAGGAFGRAGLGTALTASFILQTAPSVWKAYRSERVSGISAGTWLLILGELLCWGIYGTDEMDPRLMVLGWAGVAISLLILTRVAGQVRSLQRDTALVMITDDDVRRILGEHWDLPDEIKVDSHDGGMGSRTWIVVSGEWRWVIKAVAPHLADSFAKGLRVARMVESAGVPAGAAVPTASGEFTVDAARGWRAALLTWVPGVPLTGADEREQRLIGTTLARVHLGLQGQAVEGAQRFHWVDPAAPRLDLRSWIRPAVSASVAELADLELDTEGWPRGLLHADPAPEAFRCDASGNCGVIDWSSALHGPLLYDVASAAMYLGGLDSAAPMIDAYRAAGPLTEAQLAKGLPILLRFRWAVQADYFAWRITENDLTGISGPEENEKGLEDARRALLNVDG